MSQNAKEIETWIVNWLAENLDVEKDAIDREEAFVNLGLSSRQAVFMAGELEDWFGDNKELEPSLAWDHPTIKQLSAHLAAS